MHQPQKSMQCLKFHSPQFSMYTFYNMLISSKMIYAFEREKKKKKDWQSNKYYNIYRHELQVLTNAPCPTYKN